MKLKIQKKILISLCTCITATALADVNLYGKVATGIENDQFQNSTVPGTGSIQDFGSYFGLRGTDQVYGETAAIWQIEQYLDTSSGQAYSSTTGSGMIVPNGGVNHVNNQVNTLASSETYLGLQGIWGRIRMGNLSNYMRSDMGNVDMYNYASGVNGLGSFSRTNKLVSTSMRYDSPTWHGISFGALYGFSTNGLTGVSSVNNGNNFSGGLGGVYAGGIYSFGLSWSNSNWNVDLGTMVWQNVGTYSTGSTGMSPCSPTNGVCYPNSAYGPAYANRLEIGFNDVDGLIFGTGIQTTSGLAWNSWANSGGTLGVTYNPAFAAAATQLAANNQLQTQEIAVSLGYHLGPWTPKISYAYGNNLMVNGDMGNVLDGDAQQIPNSGYQQLVAELDWNITPRTIAFANFGQVWYGSTLTNVAIGQTTPIGSATSGVVNGNNAYQNNQSTVALGFSHTF